MKVRAIKPGFHGKLREVDEEFDVADGRKASWYVPVGKEPAAPKPKDEKPKAKDKEPTAGKPKDKEPAADSKAKGEGENSDDLV